jgi:hypothetical protein
MKRKRKVFVIYYRTFRDHPLITYDLTGIYPGVITKGHRFSILQIYKSKRSALKKLSTLNRELSQDGLLSMYCIQEVNYDP